MTLDSDIAGALGDNGPVSGASEMEVMRPHLIGRHPAAPIEISESDLPANVDEGGRGFTILAVAMVLLGVGLCVAGALGAVAVIVLLLV